MQHDPRSFARNGAIPAPAPLDWSRLVATLAAYQASTRTAQVAMRLDGVARPAAAAGATLADLLEGGRDWAGAAIAMAGRFHGELPRESGETRGSRS